MQRATKKEIPKEKFSQETQYRKEYAPPKNLAQCADAYYQLREQRLAAEKEAKILQEKEAACRDYLINNLPKAQASGIAGKVCRVTVENKAVASVVDWSVEAGVWGFVLKNIKKNPGLSGLFQRRINETMIKEYWNEGRDIPGVARLDVPVLRVSKL